MEPDVIGVLEAGSTTLIIDLKIISVDGVVAALGDEVVEEAAEVINVEEAENPNLK